MNNGNNKITEHRHHIYCNRDSSIYKILMNDDLNEFLNKYKTSESILDDFHRNCISDETCNIIKPIECILKYNNGKIALHTMKEFGMTFYGFLGLMNLLRTNKNKVKYEIGKKLFLKSILYSNLTQDETSFILTKLFSIKEWDLIDLFHMYGYKVNDIESMLKYIDDSKMSRLINYGYKFSEKSIALMLTNEYISLNKIEQLGLKNEIIMDNKNRNILLKLYKNGNIENIKYIESKGFDINNDCLDNAVDGFNFDIIFDILNHTEYKLKNDHLYKLLFIDNEKKHNRNINRYRYNRRRQSRFILQSYKNHGKIMKSIKNYGKYMIDILNDHISEKQKNIIDKKLDKIMPNIIYGYSFDFYEYLKENYFFNTELNKNITEDIMRIIINNDDIVNLKKIIEYKLIIPIDISSNTGYMNMALHSNSSKIIEYFHNDLKMVCNNDVIRYIKYNYNIDKECFIKNLEKIEYPLENIIDIISQKGTVSIIKYLIDKDYKMSNKTIEHLLSNKHYELANYMLDNGYKLNCKYLIDRILNNNINNRHYRIKNRVTIRQINHLIKLGGTATQKSSNILVERGIYNCVVHLYTKFGLVPSKEAVIKNLSRWYINNDKIENIIKYVDYMIDVMKIDIFNNIDQHILDNIIYINCTDDKLLSLKYLSDKLNYTFTSEHINRTIDYNDNIETLKFLENKGVIITKEHLLMCVIGNYVKCAKYIHNKYKFDLTLKDIHNLIITARIYHNGLKCASETFNIKYTPYTVKLIIEKYLNRWDYTVIKYIILNVRSITQESYNRIINSNHHNIIKIINKSIKDNNCLIVNYQPSDEELADQQLIIHNNNVYYDNESDDDINENDKYIKKVIEEVDIDKIIEIDSDNE